MPAAGLWLGCGLWLGEALGEAEALAESVPVCVTLGDAEADADAEELAELPFERVAVAEGEAGSVGEADAETLALGDGARTTLCAEHEALTVSAATLDTLPGGTPVVVDQEASKACMSVELASAAGSPSCAAILSLNACEMPAKDTEGPAPPTAAACATDIVMTSCVKATGMKQASAGAPDGGGAHSSTCNRRHFASARAQTASSASPSSPPLPAAPVTASPPLSPVGPSRARRRRREATFAGSVALTGVKPSGVVLAPTAPAQPGTLTRLTLTEAMMTPLTSIPPSSLAVVTRRPWPKPEAPPPMTAATPPPTSGKVARAEMTVVPTPGPAGAAAGTGGAPLKPCVAT